MSLLTLSSNKKINLRIEFLVYGYIRLIKVKNNIIPDSIINLCLTFYYTQSTVFCIKEISRNKAPEIGALDLDTKENYQWNVKPLNENIPDIKHKLSNTGICIVKDFKFPREILSNYKNLHAKSSYNVVFTCGVGSGTDRKHCIGYIIDKQI